MSITIMSQVFKSFNAKANDKLVMLALADEADDSGFCFPTIAMIAAKCCCDRATVKRVLSRFELKGFVQTVQKGGVYNGRNYASRRQIVIGSFVNQGGAQIAPPSNGLGGRKLRPRGRTDAPPGGRTGAPLPMNSVPLGNPPVAILATSPLSGGEGTAAADAALPTSAGAEIAENAPAPPAVTKGKPPWQALTHLRKDWPVIAQAIRDAGMEAARRDRDAWLGVARKLSPMPAEEITPNLAASFLRRAIIAQQNHNQRNDKKPPRYPRDLSPTFLASVRMKIERDLYPDRFKDAS